MKIPCPHCGKEYEHDNAWHSWDRHVQSCIKNPQIQKVVVVDMQNNLTLFEQDFIEIYKELTRTEIFGINNPFVPIVKLRSKLSKITNLKPDFVDEYLRALLLKNDKIRLHGAPTSEYARTKKLFYNEGRLWIYISMNA